jgi:hypothetical protein
MYIALYIELPSQPILLLSVVGAASKILARMVSWLNTLVWNSEGPACPDGFAPYKVSTFQINPPSK